MSFDLQINNNLGNFALLQHDVSFDASGSLVTVTGTTKLVQDIQKILFTTRNYFYNQYSTNIQQFIGTNTSPATIIHTLNSEVTNSLNYLVILQQSQAKYQQVFSSEIIQEILLVDTEYVFETTQNENDLTAFKITIVVQNAAGQNISVNRTVSLN
jgi:hypothetical protein